MTKYIYDISFREGRFKLADQAYQNVKLDAPSLRDLNNTVKSEQE